MREERGGRNKNEYIVNVSNNKRDRQKISRFKACHGI